MFSLGKRARMLSKSFVLLYFSLLIAVMTGCVSQRTVHEPIRKKAGPALLVGRGVGDVTLKWTSQRGAYYTILYSDDLKNPDWKPHPKLHDIAGTGADIVVKDRPARGKKRFYRLYIIPPRS